MSKRQSPPAPPAPPAGHRPAPPRPKPAQLAPVEVLASQRRRLLAKHYISKYRVRRGR